MVLEPFVSHPPDQKIIILANPATPSVPQLARRSAFPEDVRSTPRAAPLPVMEERLIQFAPHNGDLEKKKTEEEVKIEKITIKII